MNIYGIRDVIADEVITVFLAKNDLVACRLNLNPPKEVVQKDFEIVRIGELSAVSEVYPCVSRLDLVPEKLNILTEKSQED